MRIRQQGIRFQVERASLAESELTEQTDRADFEHYFGLDQDQEYRQTLDRLKTDEPITRAINRYYGLRLLRQPAFEILISFILSANNTIPVVARTVQAISKQYGHSLQLGRYRGYIFPTPQELRAASESELAGLGAEYRAKYIYETTRMIVEQAFDFEHLQGLPYAWAHGQLTIFPGVGRNVADWVMLFALGQREAFPLDTWVTRAMETFYFGSQKTTPKEIHRLAGAKWGDQAGYANEFLYMYARNNLSRNGAR